MCINQMIALPDGYTENHKIKYKFYGNAGVYNFIKKNNKIKPKSRERPEKFVTDKFGNIIHGSIILPCGQCWECRLQKSRVWADRCMAEASQYKNNYFITLTYNNNFIPVNDLGYSVLEKSAISDFMKRFREAYYVNHPELDRKNPKDQVRFYGCGEYGDKYSRCHYHLILFNVILDDLELDEQSSTPEFKFYTSKFLEKEWTGDAKPLRKLCDDSGNPLPLDKKGNVKVTSVSWDTCAYVARYCMKKLNGQAASFYEEYDLVPEFSVMSRKPGIGRNWFDKNKDKLYHFGEIYMSSPSGSVKIMPNQYYDRLYDETNHDELNFIKFQRQQYAFDSNYQKNLMSDKSDNQIKRTNSEVKKKRIESLKRNKF